jgi:hypothetical protein
MDRRSVVFSKTKALVNSARRSLGALIAKPSRQRHAECYSLCIFKPDGIGDFVLALGTIGLLIDQCGTDNCVLILWPAVSELADLEFPRVRKIYIPHFRFSLNPRVIWRCIGLRKRLGTMRFEKLVCLRHQRSPFQELTLNWLLAERSFGITNQAGYNLRGDCEMTFDDTSCYPKAQRAGLCLELEAHIRVAERLLKITVPSDVIIPAFRTIKAVRGNYILVCPFGSVAIKSYPISSLEFVVAQIYSKYGMPIMLTCSLEQMEVGEEIGSRLKRHGVKVLPIERLQLPAFLGAVANAYAVLTVDTATAHVATAFDIPTVVILGGGHYGQFGPWSRSQKQEWLTNFMDCFHCNWKCTKSEPFCITDIEPPSIIEALFRVINHH